MECLGGDARVDIVDEEAVDGDEDLAAVVVVEMDKVEEILVVVDRKLAVVVDWFGNVVVDDDDGSAEF